MKLIYSIQTRHVPNFFNATITKFDYKAETNNKQWWYGIFIEGYWYKGVWNNGIWLNGYWRGGTWYKGLWVNGTWNDGFIQIDLKEKGLYPKLMPSRVSPKSYRKPKNTISLNYANYK